MAPWSSWTLLHPCHSHPSWTTQNSNKITEKRWPKSSSKFQLASRSLLGNFFGKNFEISRPHVLFLKPCNTSPQSSVWRVFTQQCLQLLRYYSHCFAVSIYFNSRFSKLYHVYWRSRKLIISETYLARDKIAPIIGVEFWLQYFMRYYIKLLQNDVL